MYNTEFKIIDRNTLEILLYNDNKEIILDLLSKVGKDDLNTSRFIVLRDILINTVNNPAILDVEWDYDDDEHYYYNTLFVRYMESMYGEVTIKVDDNNDSIKKFNIILELYRNNISIELSDEDSNEFIYKYIEICNILEYNIKR